MTGRGHRVGPHTADAIVDAWGPTRDACLEELCLGLASMFGFPRPGSPSRRVTFRVGPAAGDELVPLVLEEVLVAVDVERAVPIAVALTHAGDVVDGEFVVVDVADVEPAGAVPKAVSWEDLCVAPDDAGTWRAHAVVDV